MITRKCNSIIISIIVSTIDCIIRMIVQFGNKTKKCNLADEAKAMVAADKKCKKAYGECRK